MSRHLVLVGGGHAHLAVLRSLARERWPEVRVTLISPDRWQLYSGMVPGYLRGRHDLAEMTVDLERLCAASGTEWVEAAVEAVDARSGRLQLDSRRGLRFEVASLDIGSVPAGRDLPGVREHAWPLRPLSRVTQLRDRLDALARNRHRAPVTVVGGGAAGIETTLAIHRRMVEEGGRPRITVVDGADRLLPDYPEKARAIVRRSLEARGIDLRLGTFVAGVRADTIEMESGEELEASLVVWAAGASPPPLIERTDLKASDRGYLAVDRTLRARPAPDGGGAAAAAVFGAGDCVDVADRHLPRAGVYAVREGEVLARNLNAFLAGEELDEYEPQETVLSLLDTADGQALFSRDPWVFRGRSARLLKDWIDRRFVRKYRRLELPRGALRSLRVPVASKRSTAPSDSSRPPPGSSP